MPNLDLDFSGGTHGKVEASLNLDTLVTGAPILDHVLRNGRSQALIVSLDAWIHLIVGARPVERGESTMEPRFTWPGNPRLIDTWDNEVV